MFCKISWKDCRVYEKRKVKIIRKDIKHIYAEVKEDYIEIRCNKYISGEVINGFIEKIKSKIEPKKTFVFGEEGVASKKNYEKLEEIVLDFVEKYSKKMNLFHSKISFREKKTFWGSCTFKNYIILNYKLVNLPIDVIKYIVVYELAHIKEKNHSKRFWSLVKRYIKDYKEKDKILKEYSKRIK